MAFLLEKTNKNESKDQSIKKTEVQYCNKKLSRKIKEIIQTKILKSQEN